MNAWLLASGLSIGPMNRIRKRVSRFKGGRLAAPLRGRRALCLLISDVPGNDAKVIGSGPVIPHRPEDIDVQDLDLPDWLAEAAAQPPPLALPEAFDRIETANLAIVIGFYLSFVGNTIFPAVSPYRVMQFDSELAGLWLYDPLHHLIDILEPNRLSAFPSGHILVAAIVVGLTALWRRDVLPVFFTWALVLWLGTIYLRYHYLVDTLVSLPLAPPCIWVAHLGHPKVD